MEIHLDNHLHFTGMADDSITPMEYHALIPFLVLFTSFALFRIELVYSAFIAFLSCVAIFGASSTAFISALTFLFEIGLIILGAFFFIEVAEKKGVIHSLAEFVKEVSANRMIQAILVSFPLTLIVEGSSGFGTPLLIIAPLLRVLGLPLILCAILPMINMVNGIPYGALGTPIRLGIGSDSDLVSISHQTIRSLSPLFWISPILSYGLIRKYLKLDRAHTSMIWYIWILGMSAIYHSVTFMISKSSVEFPALAGGLTVFLTGAYSAHWIEHKKLLIPTNVRGLFAYTLLLCTLWLGKQIWMDEKIPGTPLRIFNPGWIFLIFGWVISRSTDPLKTSLIRSRKTISVLFCMTFIVQQLKVSGGIQSLLTVIPSFLIETGIPLLGWLGSSLIGTGTIALLFLSPLLDPTQLGALAAGTAPGVPMAFQSIVGVRSILKEQISEREILRHILPISVGFMTILTLIHLLTRH